MKMNNGLRDMLEQMPTTQLDEMLKTELKKRPPDAAAVSLIMEILSERDSDKPVEMNAEIRMAWKEYKSHNKATGKTKYMRTGGGSLLRVASILLVLGILLFALPQEAGAKSLWDRFLHVTDSIFEFFNPSDGDSHRVEYKFETDNPGLQQVYDAVVELGITEPVVPMWLPEGCELVEFQNKTTPTKTKVHARFDTLKNVIVFQIEIYNEPQTHKYYKDGTVYKTKEMGGTTHNILRNHDKWVAIWMRDSIECSLSIEGQEEILYKILESIYVMGDE